MDDGNIEIDEGTFNVDFSGEGCAKLLGRVKEKLKEYLGDYTDDTLAEYVIVLLRNGRRKDEVRKELSVFLENDSVTFVSWLWDHLSSDLHLYLPPKERSVEEDNELLEKHNQEMDYVSGEFKSDSEENGLNRSRRDSSNRRKREWRGLGRDETFTLFQNTPVENVEPETTLRKQSPLRKSRSPRHEKRRIQEEKQTLKDTKAKPVLRAPSRLLQFAVRDVVKAANQFASRAHQISLPEPSTKRLRSTISSSINSPPDEAAQRIIPSTNNASVPKSSGNVFSRLGVFRNSDQKLSPQDCEDLKKNEQDDELSKSDSDDENIMYVNDSPDQNIFMGQEEIERKRRREDQELSSTVSTNTAKKLLNLRNPPQKEPTVISKVQEEKMEIGQQKLVNQPVEESTSPEAQKGGQNLKLPATGSYSIARPSEDADSRTIFISNVHFAATKDTLSRHFNKFGEVLKVIIVTDAATGQPSGSAYVEFLRNESAELALSLNGTSFMSRILKIVLRSPSAHSEAAAPSPWSRGSIWGQQSYPGRGGRYPFSRASIAGAQRSRLTIKPGARSLQWKRESSSPTSATSTPGAVKSLLSPMGRNLTYIRSKPDPASA